MKLASLKRGGRDGRLAVVSRDLTRCRARARHRADAAGGARRLGSTSRRSSPSARPRSSATARTPTSCPSIRRSARAPLPRAYHWVDGSAYVNHVELVRKARGAEMPASFWTDPLVYQGGSDDLLGARDDVPFGDTAWGIDLEARSRGDHRRRADGHDAGRSRAGTSS